MKCIFNEGDIKESMLYRQFSSLNDIDRFVVVGGYHFSELKTTIENEESFSPYRERVTLVFNDKYAEYGSGYSLYLGLKESMGFHPDEILFLEGDLFILAEELKAVEVATGDVVTSNCEPIYADRSVIFYINTDDVVRYVYDTCHKTLTIGEPFKAIFNSGQVWKFTRMNKVKAILDNMVMEDWVDTNLRFITRYFSEPFDIHNIQQFTIWINCNTYEDYISAKERIYCCH